MVNNCGKDKRGRGRGWGSQLWRGVTSVVRCHFCDNRGPSYILKYNCKYKYKYKYKYKHCNDWQNWNAKYHSGRVLLLWQSCLATYCTSCILKRKKTVQTKYRYKIWIQIQKRNGSPLHFNWVAKIETQNTIVARCHFCDNAFKPNDRATDTSCEPRNTTLDSRSQRRQEARDKVSLNICKDVPSRCCKFFKCEIVVKTMERGGGRKFSGLLFRTFYCFYTLLRAIN